MKITTKTLKFAGHECGTVQYYGPNCMQCEFEVIILLFQTSRSDACQW